MRKEGIDNLTNRKLKEISREGSVYPTLSLFEWIAEQGQKEMIKSQRLEQ